MEQVLNYIVKKAEEIRMSKTPLFIAIDGRCGSGKTTLGEALAKRLHASLIHMDDFYLRMEQRTEARFQEPGGNVDYERFFTDVIQPLQRNKDFSYRPFDCRIWDLGTPVTVKATPITVIEGSYACHPSLFKYYDLRIFLTVDKEEQMRRILKRNGPEKAEMFRNRWIPLEEHYFSSFEPEDRCQLVFDTTHTKQI